jgi:carbonic anhydrase
MNAHELFRHVFLVLFCHSAICNQILNELELGKPPKDYRHPEVFFEGVDPEVFFDFKTLLPKSSHKYNYIGSTDKPLARSGRKQAAATKILSFIYPIYNHNWRNISTIYIDNKTSIKRNIITIKQNTSGSKSG